MISNYKTLSPEKKTEYQKRRNERQKERYETDPRFRAAKSNLARKRRQKPGVKKREREKYKKWWTNLPEEKKRKYRAEIKERSKGYKKRLHEVLEKTKNPKLFFQFKIRRVKASAKARNLECTITVEELFNMYKKQEGRCFYTGEKLVLKISSSQSYKRENMDVFKNYATLDRLDSTKGYTIDNVVLSTLKCNMAKSSLSYDEFVKICENIKNKSIIKK